MPVVSQATIDFVNGVAAEAERIETPCGDGTMAWRCWGRGPPLVLLHGGYGSWMHWIRNVLPLSQRFHRYRAGHAGSRRLGDAARAMDRRRTGRNCRFRARHRVAAHRPPEQEKPHLAGFSFGGVIGGSVAAQLGVRLRGFTVVGSNGLGLERSPTAAAPRPGRCRRRGGIRHPPLQPEPADDRTTRTRSTSWRCICRRPTTPAPACAAGGSPAPGALVEALPQIKARLDGIWGERDATAYPHVEERARLLRSFQPKARFAVVPGAGHWVQYEAADRFNPILSEYAAG